MPKITGKNYYNTFYYTHIKQGNRFKAYIKFDIKSEQAALIKTRSEQTIRNICTFNNSFDTFF